MLKNLTVLLLCENITAYRYQRRHRKRDHAKLYIILMASNGRCYERHTAEENARKEKNSCAMEFGMHREDYEMGGLLINKYANSALI